MQPIVQHWSISDWTDRTSGHFGAGLDKDEGSFSILGINQNAVDEAHNPESNLGRKGE